MAHVLAMAARKLRDPIAIVVLMEADDPAEHKKSSASRIIGFLTSRQGYALPQFPTVTFTESLPSC